MLNRAPRRTCSPHKIDSARSDYRSAIASAHLIYAAHSLDFFLFGFELGLPQEIGARHIIALPVQNVQHDGDEQQEEDASECQSKVAVLAT